MLTNSKTGDGPAGTQTSRAVIELRNIIAEGVIPAGERLTETQLAERLNMSRTPIRAAILGSFVMKGCSNRSRRADTRSAASRRKRSGRRSSYAD